MKFIKKNLYSAILFLASFSLLVLYSCTEEVERVNPSKASMISIGDLPDSKSVDANARKGGPDNTQPVYSFADPMNEIEGSSTAINRNPNGISMNFQVKDAVAGHAYTVWLVIFNEPENCATTPCSEPDIFNPDTQTDVTYAAGTIVGANGFSVSGHRRVGDLSVPPCPSLMTCWAWIFRWWINRSGRSRNSPGNPVAWTQSTR